MTSIEFSTKNKIGQRLSMLCDNADALANIYYELYMLDCEDTLRVRQYDSTGCVKVFKEDTGILNNRKIPNLNKFLNDSILKGKVNPNNAVFGEIAQIYINTENKSIWVSKLGGNNSWMGIATGLDLTTHNVDLNAHLGLIAKINGDVNNLFKVKNIKDATYEDYRDGNYTIVGTPSIDILGKVSDFSSSNYIETDSIDTSTGNFQIECGFQFNDYPTFAWKFGDSYFYTKSETPKAGDTLYDNQGVATSYIVISYNASTGLEIDRTDVVNY